MVTGRAAPAKVLRELPAEDADGARDEPDDAVGMGARAAARDLALERLEPGVGLPGTRGAAGDLARLSASARSPKRHGPHCRALSPAM